MQYFLRPRAALGLRRTQLEHRAAILIVRITRRALATAKVSCSVQVACSVEHQIAEWQVTIFAASEAVQDGVTPLPTLRLRRRQLEHRAASALDAQKNTVAAATLSSGS